MAYDANDPADRQIVADAVAAALETAREEHEAEVTRLTNKNTELLGKLKRARGGEDGGDTAEIARLEAELDETGRKLRTAESDLRQAKRDLSRVEGERDTARNSLATETTFSANMLTENALTSALTEANVAPQFMEAAKALLSKGVKVEVAGDERTVTANGKSVADYVKEWAASDAGKHYVSAPANGGGGSNGSNANGGGGTKKLADMSESERLEMARTNPTGWQALLASEGNQTAA